MNSGLNSSCWIVSTSWHTFDFLTALYDPHMGQSLTWPTNWLTLGTLFCRQDSLITQMKTASCHWPQDLQNCPKDIWALSTDMTKPPCSAKLRDHKVPHSLEAVLDQFAPNIAQACSASSFISLRNGLKQTGKLVRGSCILLWRCWHRAAPSLSSLCTS